MDPSSARVALGISCVQTRHGHRSERNPCTRASQPVHCTHPCTVNPHLHTELRQGHQGGLYGSRWRADGDLRWVANRVSTTGTRAAGIGMCMRADGQTCSRAAALAVQVDPPSPAARPGPIHGMGRAVRCRAHALTGPTSAKCNAEHESRPTFVRTFIPRPAQVGEGCSAHDCDHNDRRKSRWHAQVDKCAHLQTLPEEFERRAGTTGQVKTWRGQRALEDGA